MHPTDSLVDGEGTATGSVRGLVVRSVSFALIAGVAFFAGITVGGAGMTPASVAAHIPLVGDGLDATPDPDADLSDFWKAWHALDQEFVLTKASSTLPTTDEKLWGAIQGLAASYGDPYTVFFPPQEAKEFMENISGSFAGVGMEIDVKDGVLTVVAPLRGTPAEAAGILASDVILEIDGKSTEGMSTAQAVQKIRGEVGTDVTFTILRGTAELTITVTRAIIQIPQTEDGFVGNSDVYRIALYEFTANSGKSFSNALRRFVESGSKKLVIDLRGNPGGYLESAVHIASYFVPKGGVVVTEDFGGKQEDDVHVSRGYRGLPEDTEIVVLVDGGSASASEILASALQDTERATIIGTKSFGKGSVQQLIDIGDASLKVTIAKWITPDGHSLIERGVVPDIEVARTVADIEAKKDPQLDRAVKFLTEGK